MNKLLFIFLDGVGLGKDEDINPIKDLFKPMTGRKFLLDSYPLITEDLLLKPIDAVLGVDGIPQSATGQTSIMTGVNAQKLLGHHHTAFPNEPLIDLIKELNLLKAVKDLGFTATCANMYSTEYFEKRSARVKNMFPVSALSIRYSDTPYRFIADYNNQEAVFADITNNVIKSRGYDIDIITPEVAADNMLNICNKNDFVFFEYFITDTYGHKKKREELLNEVDKLNRFIKSIWNNGDNGVDIILTSDHGNCEDISTGNHTTNPVPFLFISKNQKLKDEFYSKVASLTDFKEAVINYFT